ncbi:MAG TPA: hypothetical protein ENJ45_04600, partial [Phaeodactylibacter sp.]|nr:hypothetical protein [Phaeodactylibacter sp.]
MKSIFLLFTITLFFSCNLINPDEKEPAYLHIASYTLSASSTQGGNTHKVTDAWVYVNGNSLGAYQMPVTLPVLETGEVVLEIFPGIKTNGIAELPEIYPFYKRDSIAIEL